MTTATTLTPFEDFTYTWPTLSCFLSTQEVQNIACCSRAINKSLKAGFLEAFNTFFTTMRFRYQEDALLYSETLVRFVNPTPEVFSLFKGEIYRIHGLYKKAMLEFEQLAVDSFPPTSPFRAYVMTAKAIVAIWKGNRLLATELLEASYKLNPEYRPTLLYRFNILQEEKKEEALLCIQKLLKQDPENLPAQARMAEALCQGTGLLKNPEHGKVLLLTILKKCREDSAYALQVRVLIAARCYEEGNFSGALTAFRRCLTHPALMDTLLHPKIHLRITELLLSDTCPLMLKDANSAYASLKEASCTDNLLDLYTIARLFIHKNLGNKMDAKKAINLCDRILQADPSFCLARKMRGKLLYQENQSLLAFHDLYHVYKQDKEDKTIHEYLINLLTSGEVPEDVPLLQELLGASVGMNTTSPEILCENYLTFNFQQKRNQAKQIQQEAEKLLKTEHNYLAYGCLGESFLVLGDTESAYNCFSRLKPWVEIFQDNPLMTVPMPSKERHLLSRYALTLLHKTHRKYDDFVSGIEWLLEARMFNRSDALVECTALTLNTKWNDPEEIDRVFLLDPTNLLVAYITTDFLLKKDAAPEVYQIVDRHLTHLLESYPDEVTLMLMLAATKSKIPGCETQLLQDLYTKVIDLGKAKREPAYAEALIMRAKLLCSSNPHHDWTAIDHDLLQVYESCISSQSLMSCAEIYTEHAQHFEHAHAKALKFALKAYTQAPFIESTMKAFIGELYKKGGLGITQSQRIAATWMYGADPRLSIEDCLSIATSIMDTDQAEAAFYFTVVFRQAPTENIQKLLLSTSLTVTL